MFADDRAEDDRTERKFRSARQLTEQAFGLVPLGDEVFELNYFFGCLCVVSSAIRTIHSSFFSQLQLCSF